MKRRVLEARGPLCEVLQSSSKYASLQRKAALEGLRALGAIPCAADVLKQLGHQYPGTRAAAALAAGTLGTPEAVAGVLQVLRDPDPTVRAAGVEAAGGRSRGQIKGSQIKESKPHT